MESPASIRDSIRQGDWAVSIDLTDAYFHILVHPRDRKWFCFSWDGKSFQFRALPFGLAPAPWVFIRVVRELCLALRSKGIRLRVYLDDWLILAESKALCQHHLSLVRNQCQALGFLMNTEKSELEPSQQFKFLGMAIDSVSMTIRPAMPCLHRLHSLLSHLSQAVSASARELACLLGFMESLAALVPLGRLHKRPFQRHFQDRWSQSSQTWDTRIPLGTWFSQSTQRWMDMQWLNAGVPISNPTPDAELYTDASNMGWGTHMENHTASGTWFPHQQSWHINKLELEAVFLALQHFLPHVSHRSILLCTDNMTVACYLN
ncbi:uncharacterized protein LOC143277910 [Babylonia areolata]|uniref:uncharacterized protein LOC143277910 n=1 Tax=Babylonia areolata TaxID=304850 RepID=UPI003FD03819